VIETSIADVDTVEEGEKVENLNFFSKISSRGTLDSKTQGKRKTATDRKGERKTHALQEG
jgi:hypothetical protein